MSNLKESISPFKPYLSGKASYKGGKAIHEISVPGKKIYKLSSNENPLSAAPKALTSIQANLKDLHIYPDRTAQKLQQALAQFYKNEIPAEQFFVANSGSEVLDIICRGFLGEGLEGIICTPSFPLYRLLAKWQGAQLVDIPLQRPDFSLNLEGILQAINENTRLIFVTSPNNPTGTYIPKRDIETLIEQLPEHVVLILDEVYWHFVHAEDYTNALPYVLKNKAVIGVNSFSKTFGLAALRAGYGYSTPAISAYLHQLIKPFLINSLSMNAAIAALEDEMFLSQIIDLVKLEKQQLYSQLDQLPLQYWPSQTNFIYMETSLPGSELAELLQEEGIMVRATQAFGTPHGIRVSIGNQEANAAFIQALQKTLLK